MYTNKYKQRARKLVAQMTVMEKASQLRYDSPAVERLGIPAYNWWNEALHGVARAGTATMFPQAIALAAMFDEKTLQKIADAIATEGRAKYNESIKQGDRDIYKGLTFWSPNVNIFRDPRWGRGHETYGEDPYLTARLGVAFVKGLQGEGEQLKSAACAKHFAVHSGPEAERHSFDAQVSQKDLWETYLPAFEACVTEAQVQGIMGAYNRTNGEPCCGSKTLLRDILREKWGFDGYVVSDCWAIRDFHLYHRVTRTAPESAAMALKNGCDLNCGNVYLQLLQAMQEGLATEEDISRSAERVLETRLRLGLLDGSEYDSIPYERVDCPEHHRLSLEAVRKSAVLLKNDGILPLDRERFSRVAVIGPNADSRRMLIGNYYGTASRYVTLLDGIRETAGEGVRILYSEGCHLTQSRVEGLALEQDRLAEAVTVAENAEVVILCLGLDSKIEGEGSDDGNPDDAGDKANLDLPATQQRLLERILKVGRPTVLLLSSGSALAVGLADEQCSAVMQTWYPGAEGGLAVGRLLFGDENPGGKLPVTFYRATEDLPPFGDYSMKGRTYRYMEVPALYPFGYGLSYSRFEYENLTCQPDGNGGYRLSVSVRNVSKVDGEEVAQVYVKLLGTPHAVRNHSLCAFSRVALGAGEERRVELPVNAGRLMVVNGEGERVREGSEAVFYVGGSQPDPVSVARTGQKPLEWTVKL